MRLFEELARRLAEVVDHALESLTLLGVLDRVKVDGTLVGTVVKHVQCVDCSLRKIKV